MTFDFGQSLPTGNAVLKIKYEAVLNDDMAGFYRSKYTVNGETRWMATTQFEATGKCTVPLGNLLIIQKRR